MGLFSRENAPTCKIQQALLSAEFKYLLKWPFSHILLDLKAHRGSDDFVNTVNLLNVLVGTWDTTITMLNPDGAAGDVSSAIDAYAWSPNGFFLMHDVDATMGGQRLQSLEIIEGAPPAEYGDKTSLVVVATTRSGQGVTKPTGAITLSYGSFGTANPIPGR